MLIFEEQKRQYGKTEKIHHQNIREISIQIP